MLSVEKKIVLIGSSSFPGVGQGISSYCSELVDVFNDKGWEVHVACPNANVIDTRFKLIVSNPNGNLKSEISRLIQYSKEEKVTLIINNDNPYVQSIAPYINVKFISVCHMNRTSVMSLSYYNEAYLSRVVAISKDMHSKLNTLVNDSNKLKLVYNAVKDTGYNSDSNITSQNKLKIMYCGGSNENKGISYIRNICSHFSGSDKVEISLYGNYSKSDLSFFNSFSCVIMHGKIPREQLISQMYLYDCLLFPSRVEGCPVTIIEALSKGVIVITSDGKGAMKELVPFERFVLPLKLWDVAAIKMIYHIMEQENIEELRSASRNKYEREFTTDIMYNALVDKLDLNSNIKKGRVGVFLKWHRQIRKNNKASILDRLCIKFGFLRKKKILLNWH
tara:strand:+ start:6845 stop:8017 length:1173 start_codon:yes stop_codon:yes gene_type:complete